MSEWGNQEKKIFEAVAVGDIGQLTDFFQKERDEEKKKIVNLTCDYLILLPPDSQSKYIHFDLTMRHLPPLFIPFFYSNNRKAEVVELLLSHEADVNASALGGETPLFMACAFKYGVEEPNDKLTVVELLLTRGADVNSQTEYRYTPLMIACANIEIEVEVVELLLTRGADVNAYDVNIETPLMIACRENNSKVVELLLRHGADANAHTYSGITPLMIACRENNSEVVKSLLRHGADVNAHTYSERMTPLMMACRENNSEVVKSLLTHGVDVNAKTRHGHTAYSIAIDNGNKKIQKILERWATTKGIIVLQELVVYHLPEAEFYNELKDFIGTPNDAAGADNAGGKRKRRTNKKQKNKRRKTIRNIKNKNKKLKAKK
jgi:ankyrin repeat protein